MTMSPLHSSYTTGMVIKMHTIISLAAEQIMLDYSVTIDIILPMDYGVTQIVNLCHSDVLKLFKSYLWLFLALLCLSGFTVNSQ